eukprot:gb/GECG01013091.1/.p1 GENE.gb/GECG01013091.1/~~gb/GECG01013091.1/.p1  ORF type:complete len:141 (+),score=20.26 gb/GECG01013091.1/:1-423(+)
MMLKSALLALCALVLSGMHTSEALGGNKVGGFRESDSTEQHVQDAAREVVKAYNAEYVDSAASKLVKVVRSKHQVVAGMRYEMTVMLQQTTCAVEDVKDDSDALDSCNLDESAAPVSVHAVVLWQSWSDPSYRVEIKETK